VYTPLLLDLLHLLLREKLITTFIIKNRSKVIIKFNPKNRFFLKPIQQPNILKYTKKIYFDLIYSTSKGLHMGNYYSNKIIEGQPLLLVSYNKL
jgi:hypothetical protein